MKIVSAREIRANQGNPVTEEDTLTTRICKGLQQVKMMEEGKLPKQSIQDLLDAL